MKITCNVIEDLLPLYVEGLTSDDTNFLIEEHLKTCTDCKKNNWKQFKILKKFQ